MGIQNLTPDGAKPISWNLEQYLVAPEFQWFWDGRTEFATAVWSGGSNVFDLIRREFGTKVGANSSGIARETDLYGIAINMGNTDDARIDWTREDPGDRDLTFAWIGNDTENSGGRSTICLASDNASFRTTIQDTGNTIALTKGGVVDISSGIVEPTNETYFCAISYRQSDGNINFLVRNFITGVVTTATATNTDAPGVGDGVWEFGGLAVFTGVNFLGKLGLGVVRYDFHDMEFLKTWANDPFGPFRPDFPVVGRVAAGRIMSSLVGPGGLAGSGGIAGPGGGLAA